MTDIATTHTSNDYEPPSYDDVNTPVIVLVGVISALVTLLTIMFVQGLSYHWQNSYLRMRSAKPENMPAVIEINRQKEMLAGGEKVISIDEAMRKVVTTYGKTSGE